MIFNKVRIYEQNIGINHYKLLFYIYFFVYYYAFITIFSEFVHRTSWVYFL